LNIPLGQPSARAGGLPQRLAARRGAAMRGLDRRRRIGEDGVSEVCWGGGLATAGFRKAGREERASCHTMGGEHRPYCNVERCGGEARGEAATCGVLTVPTEPDAE
jgi:hypothetical protein